MQAVHTRRVGGNDVSDIVECNEQRDVFLLEEHARFVVIDRQVRREVDHVRPSRRHDRSLAALYESLDHQLVRAVPYGYRYLDITSSYSNGSDKAHRRCQSRHTDKFIVFHRHRHHHHHHTLLKSHDKRVCKTHSIQIASTNVNYKVKRHQLINERLKTISLYCG